MNSFIRYCTAGLVGTLTFLSLSAYAANITVLAWPGGPAEGALKKVVDNYNKSSDSQVELLYFSRDNFFDKMLADVAAGSNAVGLIVIHFLESVLFTVANALTA